MVRPTKPWPPPRPGCTCVVGAMVRDEYGPWLTRYSPNCPIHGPCSCSTCTDLPPLDTPHFTSRLHPRGTR